MNYPMILLGIILVLIVLWETFESIILPRGVMRSVRITKLFYIVMWNSYTFFLNRKKHSSNRESYLSSFGPLSLILMIALWVLTLIFGFAMVHWGLGSPATPIGEIRSFFADLYFSGTTFFTLGLGDLTPHTKVARALVVLEAGTGLGFVAVVIGYVPVIYSSFSRREVGISLLDARAGSPPCGAEMLIRHARGLSLPSLATLLDKFESWASDLMESHLSYPVVCYYRSQHDRESWVSAIAGILDTCALISLKFEGAPEWENPLLWQAQLTFAMARHAIVDISIVLDTPPKSPSTDRLPHDDFVRLTALLKRANVALRLDEHMEEKLAALRGQYEPYLHSLSERLLMPLPPWLPNSSEPDNWESDARGNESHL